MQTYSHVLIAAGAGKLLSRRGARVHTRAFVLGALLPDIPLFLLSLGFLVKYVWLDPVPPDQRMALYDRLYFTHPLWIVGHNLFHAPPLLALYTLVGAWGRRRGRPWGEALWWLAWGAISHSLVDIFTHHHDGPLLLFPFNWQLRFHSPISYWDPRHYGRIFAPLEHLLDLFLLVFILIPWWRNRRRRPGSAFWRGAGQNR